MKILALIPARGGSVSIPRKNLAVLGSMPLIAWTIIQAKHVAELDRIIVSTEDVEIAETAKKYGAEVPFMRPKELAQSDTPTIEVAFHALDWLESNESYFADAVLLLQPTSPFRTAADIKQAIGLLSTENCPAVVSVTPSHPHPFLAFRVNNRGCLDQLWNYDINQARRQDLPDAYYLNGAIYLIWTDVLRRCKSFIPPGTKALIMPRERSLDIDEPFDLLIARALLEAESWEKKSRLPAA
jgi:CMP-N,N'-diacetyllegionaminic acid synthase